ncbi:hypothetical protein B0H16DRAFT_244238 [Mycena metata]|uniref:G-protein coupled receptors family 2 profile 2 domain-containing protein n=1 Tax=Mycena metata TaxID=1033252 RepID=A0AAD7HTV3_9AGAR|nr:hypothetical protein B0H16DRAFT_244238 [Mycena metata]
MSPRLHIPAACDYHIFHIVLAFAVADIAFISLILGTCLWAAWNPVSRPHLNRVSFRLLIYALIANLGYVGCMIPLATVGAGAACTGSAFFANVCILFAAIMFFCMALNLQLVLIHGVNGQSMEKYYVTGAVVMTVVCTIPPYAAGALGFYPDINTCWFNSPDPTVQLRWFVGTLSLWLLLLLAGEVVCFFMIVGSMIMRHHVVSSMPTGTSTTSFSKP